MLRIESVNYQSRYLTQELQQYAHIENLDPYQLTENIQLTKEANTVWKGYVETQEVLQQLGVEPNIINTTLFYFDKLICSDTQLPALSYIESGGDLRDARKIANLRLFVGASLLVQAGGTLTANLGVSDVSPSKSIGAVGIALRVISAISEMHFKNSAGSIWSNSLEEKTKAIKPYLNVFNAELKQAGFADEEIQSVPKISTSIYTSELHIANLQRLQNILLPASAATAMIGYEHYGLAAITFALGLSTFPVGEIAHKQADKVRAAQFRAGRSAGIIGYLKKLSKLHIRMTDKLNSFSQLSELLTATVILMNNNGNLLADINGLRYGLTGLSGSLTQQRNREQSRRTVELGRKLIDIISSDKFILTPHRWLEHIQDGGKDNKCFSELDNGLVIQNFSTTLPDGYETDLPPVNIQVSSGETVALKAKSGLGKSSLIAGLMHFFEHKGHLYFVENGLGLNAHNLENPARLNDYIVYIAPDSISPSDQIVDIFKAEFNKIYPHTVFPHPDDQEQYEVGVRMGDSLLMAEFEKLNKKEKTIFPSYIIDSLKMYRSNLLDWVNQVIASRKGNLAKANIHGERVFSTLSAGEKQRLVVLYALEKARLNPQLSAVILDEPLAQLDAEENLLYQLQTLQEIKQLPNAPALLIISHQHVNEMINHLGAKVVNLENS